LTILSWIYIELKHHLSQNIFSKLDVLSYWRIIAIQIIVD